MRKKLSKIKEKNMVSHLRGKEMQKRVRECYMIKKE